MNTLLLILVIITFILLILSLILSHALRPGGARTFFTILTYITVILVIILISWLVIRLVNYEKAAKIAIPAGNPINPSKRSVM